MGVEFGARVVNIEFSHIWAKIDCENG